MIKVETANDKTVRYHIRLRSVLPGSMLMCPANEGSFNAIAAVGQIGFTIDAKGNGMLCIIIQRIGKRIPNENRLNAFAAGAISVSEVSAVANNNPAAAKYVACCAKAPLAIDISGIIANSAIRRDEASNK